MHAPPVVRGSLATRSASLFAGLLLFALGIVFLLESRLGLSPWDVLNQGVSEHTSLSFGTANIAIALIVLVPAWSLGARIGPGTVANAVLIGLAVDGLLAIDAVDALSDAQPAVRVVLMVAGVLMIGIGSGFYIGAAMGAGPRDSLMLVLAERAGVGSVSAGRCSSRGDGRRFRAGRDRRDRHVRLRARDGPAVELSFWLLERSPRRIRPRRFGTRRDRG